ncbi:MAG: hypothetical protein AB2803_14475 [Candidatus Thiodiazotropha sp.]
MSRAEYLDFSNDDGESCEVYAFNVIRPVANIEDGPAKWAGGRGPEIKGKMVREAMGRFIYPWRWDDVDWHLFGRKDSGDPWKKVEAVLALVSGIGGDIDSGHTAEVRDKIETGLAQATDHSTHAFSGHPDDARERPGNDGVARSLSWVYALAPYTHQTAPVSNAILNLAGFFSIQKYGLDEYQEYVVFPTFGYEDPDGNRRVVNFLTEHTVPQDNWGGVYIDYDPASVKLHNKNVRFITRSAKRQLTEVLQYGKRPAATIALPKSWRVAATYGTASRVYTPDRVLANVVLDTSSDEHAKAEEWVASKGLVWRARLAALLGLGWERKRKRLDVATGDDAVDVAAEVDQHVFEALVGESWLIKLFKRPEDTRWWCQFQVDPFCNTYRAEWGGWALFRSLFTFLTDKVIEIDDRPVTEVAGEYFNPFRKWRLQRQITIDHPVVRWLEELLKGDCEDDFGDGGRRVWAHFVVAITDEELRLDIHICWWAFLVSRFTAHLTEELKEELIPGFLTALVAKSNRHLSWSSALGALQRSSYHSSITGEELMKMVAKFARGGADAGLGGWLTEAATAGAVISNRAPVEKESKYLFKAFKSAIYEARPEKVRPKDDGLPIKIVFPESHEEGSSVKDRYLRGYALFLAAGVIYRQDGAQKIAWDTKRSNWLTSTALRIRPVDAGHLKHEGGEIVQSVSPVGSSQSQGRRLIELPYDGFPLSSAPEQDGLVTNRHPGTRERDFDGTTAYDYRWLMPKPGHEHPREWQLPLLGFGLAYTTEATQIDNAGGIIEADFRQPADAIAKATLLKAPADMEPQKETVQEYRSWQAPGAPESWQGQEAEVLVFDHRDQTRAARWMANQATDELHSIRLVKTEVPSAEKSPVALLAPQAGSDLWESSLRSSCTLNLTAPHCDADFIERWLNTDLLITASELDDEVKKELVSYPVLFDLGHEKIEEFKRDIVTPLRQKKDDESVKDIGFVVQPAVSAIGVVVIFDGNDKVPPKIIDHKPFKDEGGKLSSCHNSPITIEVSSGDANSLSEGGTRITVRPNSFVQVRFYSLVQKVFFYGNTSKARFESRVKQEAAGQSVIKAFEEMGYRPFGPLEYWFEVVPDKFGDVQVNDGMLDVKAPSEANPNVTPLLFEQEGIDATWLYGFRIETHPWHWNGIPASFPAIDRKEPSELIANYAGIESGQNVKTVVLETVLNTGFWSVLPKQAMGRSRALTDADRPAEPCMFTARPIVRFRDWLKPGAAPLTKLERQVIAAGATQKGRLEYSPERRMPAPRLLHSVPLCSSYKPAESCPDGEQVLPDRTQNGHMLIFDERGIDPSTQQRYGGVGSYLEVDLLQTRAVCVGAEEQSLNEVGLNPIHHKEQELNDQKALRLLVSDPSGLTEDIVRNAKPTQIALFVHPVYEGRRDLGGEWIMAKIRVRRIILPETRLYNDLESLGEDGGVWSYRLPLRIAGDKRVPADFVMDFDSAPKDVALQFAGGYVIRLPEVPECGELSEPKPPFCEEGVSWRYLVTWHEGRWGETGAVHWGAQVLLQWRDETKLQWYTEDKMGAATQKPWSLKSGDLDVKPSPEGGDDGEHLTTEVPHLRLQVKEKGPAASKLIHVSDYTEPFWASFIGMFGNPRLLRADQYSMSWNDQDKEIVLKGAELPFVTRPADCISNIDNHVRFQLLLIFRPVNSITQGAPEYSAGELVAVFQPSDAEGSPGEMKFEVFDYNGDDLVGCFGYLVSFQVASALESTDENSELNRLTALFSEEKEDKWEDGLLKLIFPPQPDEPGSVGHVESLVRPLPESLGPLSLRMPEIDHG